MCVYDGRGLGAYIWETMVSLAPAKKGETSSKGLDFRLDGLVIKDHILGLRGGSHIRVNVVDRVGASGEAKLLCAQQRKYHVPVGNDDNISAPALRGNLSANLKRSEFRVQAPGQKKLPSKPSQGLGTLPRDLKARSR